MTTTASMDESLSSDAELSASTPLTSLAPSAPPQIGQSATPSTAVSERSPTKSPVRIRRPIPSPPSSPASSSKVKVEDVPSLPSVTQAQAPTPISPYVACPDATARPHPPTGPRASRFADVAPCIARTADRCTPHMPCAGPCVLGTNGQWRQAAPPRERRTAATNSSSGR